MTRQRGFTLLEMLLAISLLVLLAGLAYGTLRLGVRGWESAGAQVDRGDAMRVGWPFLHQSLEAALPLLDPRTRKVRFDGDQGQLSWVGELPAHFAGVGPRQLSLQLEDDPNGDGRQLILRSRPLDDDTDDADTQRAVLVDQLAQLSIQYYGAGDGGHGWHDQWHAQRTLPQLVRIDIQPSDQPAWPSLIAHPYLAATSAPDQQDQPDSQTPQTQTDDAEPRE